MLPGGEYAGFTAYSGLEIDDDGNASEELIMLMNNDQLGFGYNMQKVTANSLIIAANFCTT